MAQLLQQGESFSLEGRSISLFGLIGFPSGSHWVMGINFGDAKEPSYIATQVSPCPALHDVLQVIEQDKADGKFDRIQSVMLNSRTAVRLYLEGVLTPASFKDAQEITMDTNSFMEDGGTYPAIKLESVKFGDYAFPVLIFSELQVGHGLATLDQEYCVV